MTVLIDGLRTRSLRTLTLGMIWGTLLGLGTSQTFAGLSGDSPNGPLRSSLNAELIEAKTTTLTEVSATLPKEFAQAVDSDRRGAAIQNLGRVPMYFEPNRGQTAPQVKYIARGQGYTLFATDTELVTVLQRGMTATNRSDPTKRQHDKQGSEIVIDSPQTADPNTGAVLRMGFIGAVKRHRLEGEALQPGTSNYFFGKDPKQWRSGVPHYGKVRYRELYAGVDLLLYSNQAGQFEYDFVVAPGTNPGVIQLSLQGAEEVHVDQAGNLRLALPGGGEVMHLAPHVYQMVDGSKQVVDARYVMLTQSESTDQQTGIAVERNIELSSLSPLIGFEVVAYKPDRPLIIDPVLEYATYLGGSGDEWGIGIALDSDENIYVTGQTLSYDFPLVNTLYPTYAGDLDSFILKLSANGSSLIYSTYLGGSDYDSGENIAVDNTGCAYVTGVTNSTDFPTHNALYTSSSGWYDAFVFKLNADGSIPIYSTYLGGSYSDGGHDIAVDIMGNAYVTGLTGSEDFPTVNALYPNLNGGDITPDAFISKLNADGSALIYSTFIGGSSTDIGEGITVDGTGNAYVTGHTSSVDFPTVNALNPNNSGATDTFIIKLNIDGTSPIYSTYLGGSNSEYGYGIAVDNNENVYVTGSTDSNDYPTENALYPNYAGGDGDAFVFKLNASGSTPIYSTFLGGSDQDRASGGITVDSAGNAHVTGFTASTDFPTVEALYPFHSGGNDAFVAKFNASGSTLLYSTYLGGSSYDYGNDIAVNKAGDTYVTGSTSSNDFPTQNPLYSSLSGLIDTVIIKIADDCELPDEPEDLKAKSTRKRVTLTWEYEVEEEDEIDWFIVYRSEDGEDPIEIARITTTIYTEYLPREFDQIDYYVSTVNHCGESDLAGPEIVRPKGRKK